MLYVKNINIVLSGAKMRACVGKHLQDAGLVYIGCSTIQFQAYYSQRILGLFW